MFDEKFIESLQDDPFEAARTFCQEFYRFEEMLNEERDTGLGDPYYQSFLEAFGMAQALADLNSIYVDIPDLGDDRGNNLIRMRQYLSTFRSAIDREYAETHVERSKKRLEARFSKAFHYEFSAGDINKAQTLINEIRDLISTGICFEEDHRRRLLARLEKLQAELHKKISDLDAFWGERRRAVTRQTFCPRLSCPNYSSKLSDPVEKRFSVLSELSYGYPRITDKAVYPPQISKTMIPDRQSTCKILRCHSLYLNPSWFASLVGSHF
jgi:hypothetical protein